MINFLTFNTFITQKVLIIIYYILVFITPYLLFKYKKGINTFLLIFIIVIGELFLRMFFEMLIGYFDMHDYLHMIVKRG